MRDMVVNNDGGVECGEKGEDEEKMRGFEFVSKAKRWAKESNWEKGGDLFAQIQPATGSSHGSFEQRVSVNKSCSTSTLVVPSMSLLLLYT